MGTHWGVNRSVAQIHALLYLSATPLPAEDIAEALGLARSNISTALKELMAYAIVRRVHIEGDRRDHFVAETDLWELLLRITAERKRREIDPTLALLAELSERMHEFISTLSGWYDQMRQLPKPTLVTLMKLGGKIARFVSPRGRAPEG